MRIRPSAVFILEQTEEESIRRLSNRRMDPVTGIQYNLEVNPPSDENVVNRLIEAPEDKYAAVKQRYVEWGKQVGKVEEQYKMVVSVMQSDKAMDQLTDAIADIIQNPL